MKCTNCNKDIPDDAAFCPYCVTKIEKNNSMICKNCGAELLEGVKFCHKCAAPIEPAETNLSTIKSSKPKSLHKNIMKNKPAKLIILIGIIAIAIFAGYMLFFSKPDYFKYRNCVSGDENGIIAVKKDGTVVAVPALVSLEEAKQYKGYTTKELIASKKFTPQKANIILAFSNRDFQDWKDVIQLSPGGGFGLKSDGTIISNSDYVNSMTSDINDIKYISYHNTLFAMIHENGVAEIMFTYDVENTTLKWLIDEEHWKIAADNFFKAVAQWKDLKQIEIFTLGRIILSNGEPVFQAVALKNDGTVVAYGFDYDVSKLSNIKSISNVYNNHYLAALKSDGTVVIVGEADDIDVSDWKNIVAISASEDSLAGLKSDGTVVITGDYADDLNVSDWKNIVGIYSGGLYGLTKNGQVMYSGLQEGETITEHFPDFNKLTNIGPMK